jgi:hypothetical protein
MFLGQLKVATAVLLSVGLVAGGGALARRAFASWERPASNQKAEVRSHNPEQTIAKPQVADDKDSIAYGGLVLGPDGRPIPGAKLYMTLAYGGAWRPDPSPHYATTGPAGRFTFTVPKAKFDDRYTFVAATAANYGAGWVEVSADGKRDDLTLRLVEDDVPITGQIVDLEGKPVAGVTLRVVQINAAPGEDIGPWLEAAKDKKRQFTTGASDSSSGISRATPSH